MDIFVKTLDGSTLSLCVDREMKGADFLSLLESRTGMRSDQLRVYFQNKKVGCEKKYLDHALIDGEFVHTCFSAHVSNVHMQNFTEPLCS